MIRHAETGHGNRWGRWAASGGLLLLSILIGTVPSAAAEETRRIALGPEYEASGFRRFWLGSGYRDLWTTPVTVPVLDLGTYAGGLTPVREVGGRQTASLALVGADGRSYTFRSFRKEPERVLPEEWRQSWVAWLVREHTSHIHPGAALLLPPLAEAAGLLHTEPRLFVMPDDPALGTFRERFANAPGTLEEYPRSAPGVPSFHDASEIIPTRELWDRWLRGPEERPDSRSFLRARVLDLYVENWDRHRGQWRWFRNDPNGPWQPLPEDLDMAFTRSDGLVVALARPRQPKLVSFDNDFGSRLEGSTINGSEVDRWILTDLDREAFEMVARETKAQFTDEVIADAVRRLPAEWQAQSTELASALRVRRERLVEHVMHYYRDLAKDVDIHATDRDERVSVRHLEGGSLEVGVALAGSEPYYRRRFLSSETDEVRIYLHGGNDRVERIGPAGGPILVRVITGEGEDVVDDSRSGGTDVWPGSGTVTVLASRGTQSHGSWENPEPEDSAPWLEPRNWGRWTEPHAEVMYGSELGFGAEVGIIRSNWGFRSVPVATRHHVTAGWATGVSSGRLSYQGTFRRPASRAALGIDLLASGIERVNFFGFGNETTVPDQRDDYRTDEEFFQAYPSLRWEASRRLQIHAGPSFRASWSPTDLDNVLNATKPYGSGQFAETGVRAGLDFDSRGWVVPALFPSKDAGAGRSFRTRARVEGFYSPPALDVESSFGGIEGEAAAYLGRLEGRGQLAARVGSRHVWGDYPWFEAAFLGGRSDLRGYSRNRFAGDTSLHGGLEARGWLFTLKWLPVPSRFGVLGLADAGRVWLTEEDSDKWRSSWGIGGMLQPIATRFVLTGAMAKGTDETKYYLSTRALF